MNRLWRGLLSVAILGAVAFAIFGVVLMGFAQVIPAVIVFAIAFGIALMAGPALRKKMPHDPDAYRRRMR